MNTATLDYLLWFAEFACEALGAYYAFRNLRRIWPLWGFFGFKAVADLVCFVAAYHSMQHVYNLIYLYQRGFGYALLLALIIAVCCQVVGENRQSWAVIALIAADVTLMAFYRHPFYIDWVLRFELAFCFAIPLALTLAMLSNDKLYQGWERLKSPWRMIAFGLIALAVGTVVAGVAEKCLGSQTWVLRLYPLGDLVGLIPLRYAAEKLEAVATVRQGLGVVIEPTEVIKARVI